MNDYSCSLFSIILFKGEDKETVISIEKSKLAVLEKNKNYSAEQLDPIDLLQRCGKYEVKLSELGVDPSKIK